MMTSKIPILDEVLPLCPIRFSDILPALSQRPAQCRITLWCTLWPYGKLPNITAHRRQRRLVGPVACCFYDYALSHSTSNVSNVSNAYRDAVLMSTPWSIWSSPFLQPSGTNPNVSLPIPSFSSLPHPSPGGRGHWPLTRVEQISVHYTWMRI